MRHPREKAPGQPQRGLVSEFGKQGCSQDPEHTHSTLSQLLCMYVGGWGASLGPQDPRWRLSLSNTLLFYFRLPPHVWRRLPILSFHFPQLTRA